MKKLLMVAAMVALRAIADTEIVDGIEWTYEISNGEAIVGYDDYSAHPSPTQAIPTSTAGAVAIPKYLGGCRVTAIHDYAFYGCSHITSVTIPASVSDVGYGNMGPVFFGCSALKSIDVEQGNMTYYSKNGVLFEKYYYTASDNGIELVAYPGGRKGAYAIPAEVTRVARYAFSACGGLTTLTIPKGVGYIDSEIGYDCFIGCSALTAINVEEGNAGGYYSVDGVLFEKYSYERDDGTKKSVVSLLAYPCARTGAYEIPSGTTVISGYAFRGCSLTSVKIPVSVTDIYENPFQGCYNLKSIEVDAANKSVWSVDGFLFHKYNNQEKNPDDTETHVALVSCLGAFEGACKVPSGVTDIGMAFVGCAGLTSVAIPSSVKYIYEYSFSGCANLKTIYVDKGDEARIIGMLDGSGLDMSQVAIKTIGSERPVDPVDGGFTGEKAMTFNGLVKDADGVMCGIVQIATAKATKKGVKVSGFVLLEDGKKQTLKAVAVPIENGKLNVSTKIGKSDMTLTITSDGFTGTLGEMTVASSEIDESTGILSGTIKMSYFDAKTGKVKTKSIKLTGVASEGAAVGGLTVKGQGEQLFEATVVD